MKEVKRYQRNLLATVLRFALNFEYDANFTAQKISKKSKFNAKIKIDDKDCISHREKLVIVMKINFQC